MRAPRFVAALVVLFVVLSMLQGFCWPWRPPPGWHPAWWQFHGWATFGMLITLPCFLLVVFCQNAGMQSGLILWPAMILGFILYYAAIYFGVYLVVRLFVGRRGVTLRAGPNQSLEPTAGRSDL